MTAAGMTVVLVAVILETFKRGVEDASNDNRPIILHPRAVLIAVWGKTLVT